MLVDQRTRSALRGVTAFRVHGVELKSWRSNALNAPIRFPKMTGRYPLGARDADPIYDEVLPRGRCNQW
jgi:hypothetical protein